MVSAVTRLATPDFNIQPGGVAAMRDMTDAETADHIRKYVEQQHNTFSWPTDACGYDQHIRFVRHRNENWHGGDFKQFCLDYADTLCPREV